MVALKGGCHLQVPILLWARPGQQYVNPVVLGSGCLLGCGHRLDKPSAAKQTFLVATRLTGLEVFTSVDEKPKTYRRRLFKHAMLQKISRC